MTDRRLPDDELVSAYLDGDADDAERARVERDSLLLARADELTATRHAIKGAGLPPEPAMREQHIAKALDVVRARKVVSFESVRARWAPRRLALLGAAAAVVVVAGMIVVFAGRNERGSDSSTAGRSVPTAAEAAGEGAPAPATTAAAADAAPSAPPAQAPVAAASTTLATTAFAAGGADLGVLDADTAAAILRRARESAVPVAPPACPAPAGSRFLGHAIYDARAVLAFVDDAGQRGILLDAATCVVVADVPLA